MGQQRNRVAGAEVGRTASCPAERPGGAANNALHAARQLCQLPALWCRVPKIVQPNQADLRFSGHSRAVVKPAVQAELVCVQPKQPPAARQRLAAGMQGEGHGMDNREPI